MRSLLVIVCLVLVLTELCHGKKAPDSCMQRWMARAGIKSGTDKHESLFKSLRFREKDILKAGTILLGFVMGQSYGSARSLQMCISGKKRECKDYRPCNINGVCGLDKGGAKYECKCTPGREGAYCEKEIDECSSNPCQHGGFCKNGDNKFTCTCAAGFEGLTCEKKWLKASEHRHLPTKVKATEGGVTKLSASVQALQKKLTALESEKAKRKRGKGVIAKLLGTVQALKKEVSSLKKGQTTVIGYKFASWRLSTGKRSGALRSLRFTKKRSSSLLRVSFSATVNTHNSVRKYARWYFVIDGRRCTSPGRIDVVVYQGSGDNTYFPGYLTGICRATNAGPIGRGTHTIAVHIESNGSPWTGWNSQSFMEVQEIRTPF